MEDSEGVLVSVVFQNSGNEIAVELSCMPRGFIVFYSILLCFCVRRDLLEDRDAVWVVNLCMGGLSIAFGVKERAPRDRMILRLVICALFQKFLFIFARGF